MCPTPYTKPETTLYVYYGYYMERWPLSYGTISNANFQ